MKNALTSQPRLSFVDARERMKRYLVTAYKITPVMPTILEARDALLAAAYAGDPADYVLFQQAFAKIIQEYEQADGFFRQRLAGLFAGIRRWLALLQGSTGRLQGAEQAGRLCARAHRGAQVHHGLVEMMHALVRGM